MKALVYHGPGQKTWEEVPDPKILKSTDVIVKMETTTICGTDLHILKGDVPSVAEGRILGHEGAGTIVEVGDAVTSFAVGDRVIIACISSCGKCRFCRGGIPSHCLGDEGTSGLGWILGHLIDGTQAEYVRIPYAENSLHKLPDNLDLKYANLVSDILPTGHEIGARYGKVGLGDVVAVVGCGPVGLSAIATSVLYSPSKVVAIDTDSNRLEAARRVGATHTVLASDSDWRQQVMALTEGGLGVDVAIEAVGIPATFEMVMGIVSPGGRVANIGVHGSPVELKINDLWIQNIELSMGLVNANTIPVLLKLLAEDKLGVKDFITHEFSLDSMMEAYDVFGNAAKHGAIKVAINA